MPKRYFLLVLFLSVFIGCAKAPIINVDGMPVSSHEYSLTNSETKIRSVFVLCRYYKESEGDEYLVKPEYLDALTEQVVDVGRTESLVLHLKVVNLKRAKYSVEWEVRGPEKDDRQLGLLYSGRLSRKDFYVKLPLDKDGPRVYFLRMKDRDGDDLYDLPPMRYKVEGGVAESPEGDR